VNDLRLIEAARRASDAGRIGMREHSCVKTYI